MKITSLIIILFFVPGMILRVQGQVIATIANIELQNGYSGDGESASYATFDSPKGITIHGGIIYIVDQANSRIRMIDGMGIVSTFAGNGKAGFNGDGGPATEAEFDQPTYIVFDPAGNAYISDTRNYRVRKIDTAGIITTIAGNGKAQGLLTNNVPATTVALNTPQGLAIDDSGNLYIGAGIVVRKVDKQGMISVVVGSGVTGYSGDGGPATNANCGINIGVTFDSKGNMYVADYASHVVRKIDQSGIITRYAGLVAVDNGANLPVGDGGPAINGRILWPTDIKCDKAGNLYITDQGYNRIREVDTAGIITTFAGNGAQVHSGDGSSADMAGVFQPYGITIDSIGNMYITETSNWPIQASNDVRVIFGNDLLSAVSAAPIDIYPNPTFNGVTTLLFASKYADKVNIIITNQLGQKVYENAYVTNLPIEVGLEPTGIYIVYATSIHGKWHGEISVVR